MSELNDLLKARADNVGVNSDKTRAIQRKKYHYCKDMGFTYKEAVILQNWSWEKINKLIEERQNEKLGLNDSK